MAHRHPGHHLGVAALALYPLAQLGQGRRLSLSKVAGRSGGKMVVAEFLQGLPFAGVLDVDYLRTAAGSADQRHPSQADHP